MIRIKQYALLSLLLGAFAFTGCDELSVNEHVQGQPEITDFSPSSGNIGTEIIVTGSSLDDVTSAAIGDVPVTISQRITNTMLKLKVTGNAKTGKISLVNALGSGVSDNEFVISYPAPVPETSSLPSEVEMGNKLLISGEYMNVITSVVFSAVGSSVEHEAEIISQTENEIVVTVPYVESDDANITFTYFDGSVTVSTQKSLMPVIKVKRYQPSVTTDSFSTVSVGDIVSLEGEYLDKINKVLVNGIESTITLQTSNLLQFSVPNSDDFVDGNNTTTLEIVYFDGVESQTLTNQFVVYVPYVLVYKGKTIYGQGRDVQELTSFFSPETGIAYSNSLWRTVVDPISYEYQASTCSAKNVPAVSETEYNSVKPYFFFSGLSAGTLQINSPAGSNSQLRNFYWFNNSADEYRVTGVKGSCYGTPALAFVYMDPSVEAHKEVIDKIHNGNLDKIDETTFPIDVVNNKIGDISLSNIKMSVNNSVFASGVFPVGENKSADIDAVIMVIYFDVKGQTDNPAQNIKRFGFIHITHIDFILYNNTIAPSSSAVTFDMYWMKHDYEY